MFGPGKKILVQKKFCPKKNFVNENIWFQKYSWSIRIFGPKEITGPKYFWPEDNFLQKFSLFF